MVKGINESSKCFHEIYDKNEIDGFIQTINQSIDTGGAATTANTNNINNIKHGDISTSIQLLEQEETIDNLGGTTGFKIYSVSDENTPSTNGLLLHIGKTDINNTQIFIDGSNVFIRNYTNDSWSDWSKFIKNINITSGTSEPSGGSDGDIYLKYN